MTPKKYQIRIESILGGQSPSTNFSARDQFRASLGIDPSLGITDSTTNTLPASGLLRPVSYGPLTVSLGNVPMWIKDSPKTTSTFVYDMNGSVYTIDRTYAFQGAIPDGGTLAGSGDGCEYYDNYMYFGKSDDIARYGPLNGDAVFNGTYWSSTLGKSNLSITAYPTAGSTYRIPSHVMHRHSDGKLYIADVQGNQGSIHYISTTKNTKEGDTDNGSTKNKLQFGYGLWPTAIESYGSGLAIALFEGNTEFASSTVKSARAKLVFWDTTSQNFNVMTNDEFPDQIITALKNINGILYIFSGNQIGKGLRVSQYVGGYTIKEVAYIEQGYPPFAGAVDGDSRRLIFGSQSSYPGGTNIGCVYSVGLQKEALGNNLFVTSVISTTTAEGGVYSLLNNSTSLQFSTPIIGWSTTGATNAIDIRSTDYSQSIQLWQSQVYKIGQPFKITKINFPLAQPIAANMTVTPTIYTDDGMGTTYTGGTSDGLAVINNTNYPGKYGVTMRPVSATGRHNFYLQLAWSGSALCTMSLPITIEYELLDIDMDK